jgi:ribosomal protein L29
VSKSSTNLQTLRDQSDDELRSALSTTRDELFRLQLGSAIQTKRRAVARILTILNGRKVGTETQAQKSGEAAATDAPAKKSRKAKAKS